MKRKLLCILMAVTMMFAMAPVSTFAAEDDEGQPHVIIDNGTGYVKGSFKKDLTSGDGYPAVGTIINEDELNVAQSDIDNAQVSEDSDNVSDSEDSSVFDKLVDAIKGFFSKIKSFFTGDAE